MKVRGGWDGRGSWLSGNPGLREKVPYPYGRSNPIHKHFRNIYPGSPQKPRKHKEIGKEEKQGIPTSS